MLRLEVEAVSGHYRIPGAIENNAVAQTFPIAPPSTIKGFLESLAGDPIGSFSGKFGYGQISKPLGFGVLPHKASYASSSDSGEVRRFIKKVVFYGIRLSIAVDSPAIESKIVKALKIFPPVPSLGQECQQNVLYLGESEDLVNWIWLGKETPTEWIVPGTRMALPYLTVWGYKNLCPKYQMWDFTQKEVAVPESAWISYLA